MSPAISLCPLKGSAPWQGDAAGSRPASMGHAQDLRPPFSKNIDCRQQVALKSLLKGNQLLSNLDSLGHAISKQNDLKYTNHYTWDKKKIKYCKSGFKKNKDKSFLYKTCMCDWSVHNFCSHNRARAGHNWQWPGGERRTEWTSSANPLLLLVIHKIGS